MNAFISAAASAVSLAALVDELGSLKSHMATLAAREAAIKSALIAAGVGVVEGNLFRAAITSSERETLDRKAVEALLAPAAFAGCLKSSPVVTVRVSARSAESAGRKAA